MATADDNVMDRPIRWNLGDALSVLGGISFLFVCMILPLVGPAGVATAHRRANELAFIAALVAVTVLAGSAVTWKLMRRPRENGSFPWFSSGLLAACLVLWVVYLAGWLAV